MRKLGDCVDYIRSKNAGPFWATLEIFCGNKEVYDRVCACEELNVATIANLYKIPENQIEFYYISDIWVIKISFPRPHPSGYCYEQDMHYGQQYRILEELMVNI